MSRSLRELIESVVFAGLKSGAPKSESNRMRWLGPLRRPFERFLSGGPAPTDPLYLSHRTPRQRAIFALKIVVPLAVVGGAIAWYLQSSAQKAQPKLDMSPAEMAAKLMPDVDKIKIDTNHEVEVPAVSIDPNGPALVGMVRNNTSRTMAAVEVNFEVTDETGSKLGGARARVEKVAPHAEAAFRVPFADRRAAIAVVRDIQTQ